MHVTMALYVYIQVFVQRIIPSLVRPIFSVCHLASVTNNIFIGQEPRSGLSIFEISIIQLAIIQSFSFDDF